MGVEEVTGGGRRTDVKKAKTKELEARISWKVIEMVAVRGETLTFILREDEW